LESLGGRFAALLTSLHYVSLPNVDVARKVPEFAAFVDGELARQRRLRAGLDQDRVTTECGGQIDVDRALRALRFFDALSLFVCLTPPGTRSEEQPVFVRPDAATGVWACDAPDAASSTPSPKLTFRWVDDATVAVGPRFPFDQNPLRVDFAVRDLPLDATYADRAEAFAAFNATPETTWTVTLVAASTAAEE